jgi:hypothetical protein
MDVHRFATLTRRTADAVSRRTSLLALGAAGLTAALVGAPGAEAGKKGKQKCNKEKQQCRSQVAAFCAQGADPPECEEGLLPCCATCKVGAGVLCAAGQVTVC